MVDTINVKDASGATVSVATNDAVKTSVDTTKTSVDTVNTSVGQVKTSVDTAKTAVDTVNTSVGLVKTAVDTAKTAVDTVNTTAGQVKTSVDAVKTSVDALKTVTSLGTKTIANSAAVNIASDQLPLPISMSSVAADVKATFTRQNNTTPYTANKIVGAASAAITFTNLGKTGGGTFMLTSLELEADVATAPASAFRLHLFTATPAANNTDAASMDVTGADQDNYLGWIDIPAPTDIGSLAMSQVNNIGKQIKTTGANVYGLLESVGGYTPTALAVYKITLHRLEY